MKLLFLLHSLHFGGAERQLEILVKGLRERGHDVVVSPFYAGGQLEEELQKEGIRIQSLYKRGRWDLLAFLVRLWKVIRDERPDILHSYMHVPNNVSVLIKPLFPKMKIVWGIRSTMQEVGQHDWVASLSLRLSCKISRFADAIIANSHAGCEYHVAMGYPVQKMVVIPNGIDTELFRYDPAARIQLRSEWGIADHHKLIGLVGRLDPVKDHRCFLRASALLAKRGTHFRFVCVGDGPANYKASLKDLAESLELTEYVTWVDARANVFQIYSALDLLVSSSVSEGFSNVIGEAMACGVPCVATDVGDSASIVADQGAVVAPNDLVGLMAAMDRLLNESKYDPYTIRKRIVDRFSVDNLIINMENNLTKVLNI